MTGSYGNLKLYADERAHPDHGSAELPAFRSLEPDPSADPTDLANRELLRPPTYRRGHLGLEPFSNGWFDELEHKRYVRHGEWLPSALEFHRHPGESVLLLGPGLGSDAIRYLQHGTEVTIGTGECDRPGLIRENLLRHGFSPPIVPLTGDTLPFATGSIDVVVWNALHDPPPDPQPDELFRVLKAGGKVIGLFPAYYDAGFWQDVLLPLQWLYWRRPPDPTSAPKTTPRQLRERFARFSDRRIVQRHLRRSELPHLWRVVPLPILQRLIGRVLVIQAFKPLSARSADAAHHAVL